MVSIEIARAFGKGMIYNRTTAEVAQSIRSRQLAARLRIAGYDVARMESWDAEKGCPQFSYQVNFETDEEAIMFKLEYSCELLLP